MIEHDVQKRQSRSAYRHQIKPPRFVRPLLVNPVNLLGLSRERDEALEQQAAASQVLQLISSSPGDLEPVFTSILENARRICDVTFGILALFRDGAFQIAALKNPPPAFAELRRQEPLFHPEPSNPLARVAASKKLLHIEDIAEDEAYKAREPATVLFVESAKVRTLLVVPMLKEGELVGTIGVFRQEKRPFTDKQIALLANFAAQAVIAVENARLLNELRQEQLLQHTYEALEQQTATSEVLQVISSTPGDLEPVFATLLENATRICDAKFGNLFLREEDTFRAVAWHGEPTYVNTWRGPALIINTDRGDIPLARLAATAQRVHIADLRQEAAYKAGHKHLVALIDKGGARTLLIVPMVRSEN